MYLISWVLYVTATERFYILLGIVTLALATSILLLIINLPTHRHATDLPGAAAFLWSINVFVFALGYWEIDGGGPMKRHQSGHQAANFMFPQQRLHSLSLYYTLLVG